MLRQLTRVAILAVLPVVMLAGQLGQPSVGAEAGADGAFHPQTADELQSVLDGARPGDVIVLQSGTVYAGPFRLPRKDGDGWIEIRGDQAGARQGRVRPGIGRAPRMPRLVSAAGAVITADPGAHHYRLVGLEIAPSPGVFLTDVIDLGSTARSPAETPHDISIEGSWIHGDPQKGSRRGIAMNGANISVVDSHLSDFKEVGADSQAICGWNGPGPFRIENNYLEAAGENVMFGGGDPRIADLVPSDIVITGNHFAKNLAWREGGPAYAGVAWSVKNLLELKNARRVSVRDNLFEYNWPHAQSGMAILFTVRNQDGGAPWSTIEDVSFTNNVVRHVAGGIDLLGQDDLHSSRTMQRVLISNNLFLDVGGSWGGGRLFQVRAGTRHVTISHNSGFQTGNLIQADGAPSSDFVFEDNVALHNEYGVIGTGVGTGVPTLQRYFPGGVFRGNVLIGGNASQYPGDNFFPANIAQAGSEQGGDVAMAVAAASPFAGRATDGGNPGADPAALEAAFAAAGRRAQPRPRQSGAAAVFWLAGLLVGYVYVGYPALMALLARVAPRPLLRRVNRPSVSVVVVVHDEEDRIVGRLENLLALRYPADRLEIIVASDGSVDQTVARARQYGSAVHVLDFPRRRGKAAVLNDTVPYVRGEIVVLADARQWFAPDALEAIADAMADPEVGAVSGELVLLPPGGAPDAPMGAALYWRYEKAIRRVESDVDSTVGATGAIYAIRRPLFERVSEDTILDDVVVPLRIARQHLRVIFEPRARAYDRVTPSPKAEFARKCRTMAGAFQLFARERWVWNPIQNRLWFQTLSHKGLRLLLPLAYVAALASNLALLDAPFYQATMAAQVIVYGLAIAGVLSPRLRARFAPVRVAFTIFLLAAAVVVGFHRFVTGRQRATWDQRRWAQEPGTAAASRNALR